MVYGCGKEMGRKANEFSFVTNILSRTLLLNV